MSLTIDSQNEEAVYADEIANGNVVRALKDPKVYPNMPTAAVRVSKVRKINGTISFFGASLSEAGNPIKHYGLSPDTPMARFVGAQDEVAAEQTGESGGSFEDALFSLVEDLGQALFPGMHVHVVDLGLIRL